MVASAVRSFVACRQFTRGRINDVSILSRYFNAMLISESSSDSREKMRLQPEFHQLGMLGVVVVLFRFHARIGQVLDLHVELNLSAGACTMWPVPRTENCSVNWLKTRNSPGVAGFRQAISMQRTVSRMSRKPRVCPPLP